MFWADRAAGEIAERFAAEIKASKKLIVRDEKTASGKVHVGSLRGIAIHDLAARVLREKGIPAEFIFEINDFDPMDGLPSYLSEAEFLPHMGKPLRDVPSPDPAAAPNFAEYYGREFEEVIRSLGFEVTFTRLYEKYVAGLFDDCIRKALEHHAEIRQIYKDVSGSEKPEDWYPLQVICQACGKIGTTKVTGFDGEEVTYECREDLVKWAKGCGASGRVSPFGGRAKLPWKVEWAAKWVVYGVHVEGAGKDHNAAGGSRDVSARIGKEVFGYADPYDIKYEHLLSGGKKMSSSKGIGATAADMASFLPTELIRILLVGSWPEVAAEFDPHGDTMPRLFDRYDELASHFFDRQKGALNQDFVRQFVLIHPAGVSVQDRFLPPFSQVVFLVQMPGVDLLEKAREMKGSDLTEGDQAEWEKRAGYARMWIERAAPASFVYKLQEGLPEGLELSDSQRKALALIADRVEAGLRNEELHAAIFDIAKKELLIPPKEAFQALYRVLLARDSGPKAGWFLSALDPAYVTKQFRTAASVA